MFDELDDPAGVPHDPQRSAAVKARARNVQVRRRALVAVAVLAVALPAGVVALNAREDDGVSVATENRDDETRPTSGASTSTSAAALVVPHEDTTTTVIEDPTTTTSTTLAPTTTTTIAAPPAPVFDLVAHLAPEPGATATGSAGAEQLGPTTWRITIVASGLAPQRDHSVLVHRPQPDDGTPFPTVCGFVAGADGAGSCVGTVEMPEGGAPVNASLTGYDPSSNGYRGLAFGDFRAP
jgi:hypothetical protein